MGSSNRKPVNKHGEKAEGKRRKEHSKTGKDRRTDVGGGEWQTSFKWEAFSGCLGSVRTGEQQSAQGKAAGNFGCSVFGKMQPLPVTAVSTPVLVGHPQLQWNKESAIKTEVLCSTESSGKRV